MGFDALDSLPPLRDVIAEHNLMARKALGQHFLCDLNLTRRIAESAGAISTAARQSYGIGPGPVCGATRALMNTAGAKIIAIEKDRRCIVALADLIAIGNGRLDVIEGDALKTDLRRAGAANT